MVVLVLVLGVLVETLHTAAEDGCGVKLVMSSAVRDSCRWTRVEICD